MRKLRRPIFSVVFVVTSKGPYLVEVAGLLIPATDIEVDCENDVPDSEPERQQPLEDSAGGVVGNSTETDGKDDGPEQPRHLGKARKGELVPDVTLPLVPLQVTVCDLLESLNLVLGC